MIIELIVWEDSSTIGGWTAEKGFLTRNETVGFLVREDESCVVLGQTHCMHSGFVPFANLHIIDKRSITSREVINDAEEHDKKK